MLQNLSWIENNGFDVSMSLAKRKSPVFTTFSIAASTLSASPLATRKSQLEPHQMPGRQVASSW